MVLTLMMAFLFKLKSNKKICLKIEFNSHGQINTQALMSMEERIPIIQKIYRRLISTMNYP